VEDVFHGTFDWVFSDRVQISSWLKDPNSRVFWVQGYPGSGKSTMMKYIRQNRRTLDLLKENTNARWLFSEFFFYDLGADIQKSVRGLMNKILYDLLNQRPALARFLPASLRTEILRRVSQSEDSSVANAYWTLARLSLGLKSILAQSHVQPEPLCVCLFIDALDEHPGPSQDLLNALNDLFITQTSHNSQDIQMDGNRGIRIKLCIASRPENEFVERFEHYGTLKMKDYTGADITIYAKNRLYSRELSATLLEERKLFLHSAWETIVQKAEGIFLWIRLVIDELIDGLLRGDADEDLLNIMEESPHDLTRLYGRALIRMINKWTLSEARKLQLCFESYCTLQLVSSSRRELSLRDVMRRVHIVGAEMINDVAYKDKARTLARDLEEDADNILKNRTERRLKISDKQTRLWMTNRTGGLLEYTAHPISKVRYIHQTAKKTINDVIAQVGLLAGLPNELLQIRGHQMLFRSYLNDLLSGLWNDQIRGIESEMAFYAYMTETEAQTCVANDLTSLEEYSQQPHHRLTMDSGHAGKSDARAANRAEIVGINYFTRLRSMSSLSQVRRGFYPFNLISFAIVHNLHLTTTHLLEHSREKYIKVDEDLSTLTILAARRIMYNSVWPDRYRSDGSTRILQTLLDEAPPSGKQLLHTEEVRSFVDLLEQDDFIKLNLPSHEVAISAAFKAFILAGADPDVEVLFFTMFDGALKVPLLHWAACRRLVLVVHVLANLGANIDLRDSQGRTVSEFNESLTFGFYSDRIEMRHRLNMLQPDNNEENVDAIYPRIIRKPHTLDTTPRPEAGIWFRSMLKDAEKP
jgi:hypothetical protein